MSDATPTSPPADEAPIDEVVEVAVVEVEEVVPETESAPPPAAAAPPVPSPAAPPPPPFVAAPVSAAEHAAAAEPVETLYSDATPPQQVVYIQAPVPPRKAGNRGVGALIAVGAAIVYGVVLAGITWLIQFGTTGATGFGFLATWNFYVPIEVFVIAFILLVLLVNRGPWAAHVVGSLFVGALVFFASIGISILVNWLVWQLPDNLPLFLASPFYIVAAILAREVAVWFGWIIARRGRRVTARNAVARAEFEAKLADFHAGAY